MNSFINVSTKTACTLLPYSILNQIKVDTTYLRTVILTASVLMQYVIITWVYTAELALAWSQ